MLQGLKEDQVAMTQDAILNFTLGKKKAGIDQTMNRRIPKHRPCARKRYASVFKTSMYSGDRLVPQNAFYLQTENIRIPYSLSGTEFQLQLKIQYSIGFT